MKLHRLNIFFDDDDNNDVDLFVVCLLKNLRSAKTSNALPYWKTRHSDDDDGDDDDDNADTDDYDQLVFHDLPH